MIRLVIQAYEVQSYIKLEQFISFDFFSKDSKEDTGPPWSDSFFFVWFQGKET